MRFCNKFLFSRCDSTAIIWDLNFLKSIFFLWSIKIGIMIKYIGVNNTFIANKNDCVDNAKILFSLVEHCWMISNNFYYCLFHPLVSTCFGIETSWTKMEIDNLNLLNDLQVSHPKKLKNCWRQVILPLPGFM